MAAALATPAKPATATRQKTDQGPEPDAPTAETLLVGGQPFQPPAEVAQYLEARGSKGGRVNVRFGTVAAGTIHVVRSGEGYTTPDKRAQALPLTLSLLSPFDTLPLRPVLAVTLQGGVMGGYATLAGKGGRPVGTGALLDALEEHAEMLGWLGIDRPKLPLAQNTVEGDRLVVRSDQVSFRVGGFLTASGSFGIENQAVTFAATARGSVSGLSPITLTINRGADGALTGSGEVPLELAGFSGVLKVAFGRGLVDVEGTVSYANEKFAGELTIVATDAASASALVESKTPQAPPAAGAGPATTGVPAPVGPVEAAPAAPAPPAQLAGPKPGPRVLAGWGTVKVQLADWLSGEALVVVSPKGAVTVVGKITPRMDEPLFEQRDYIRPLPKVEVRALYGVPLVGNVFLFANIGLEALAKIGPATLDRMEMVGTYSTDPKVLQNFSLTGTLNISAYAGLRVKAEGGVGVEIVDHDIKAGAAVIALAGVRGYVDATPTIGYREVADPASGKKGEFFIAGDLQLAAQPFLGLGGELFVELDSPWWSPAPDKRWAWPLGQLEYPLPGEFGIGAHVEHVLGSGKVPELELKPVEFSADRFMTDLLNDKAPPKKGVEQEKKGDWSEKKTDEPTPTAAEGPNAAPAVTGTKPAEPAKGATGRQGPDTGQPPNLANEKRWAEGMKALGDLAKKSESDAQDRTEISRALASIKQEHGFTELRPVLNGKVWDIHAAMNPKTKKGGGHDGLVSVIADPDSPTLYEEVSLSTGSSVEEARLVGEEAAKAAGIPPEVYHSGTVFTSADFPVEVPSKIIGPRRSAPRLRTPSGRRISASRLQEVEWRADVFLVRQAVGAGATVNLRVAQAQTTAQGEMSARHQYPDIQLTIQSKYRGHMVHIEYDRAPGDRAMDHARRIITNDPDAIVILKIVDFSTSVGGTKVDYTSEEWKRLVAQLRALVE